jgi:DNA-binding PucR family transcriptional regulator/putative methionine-R-sulfoxide reductase with GAF domain
MARASMRLVVPAPEGEGAARVVRTPARLNDRDAYEALFQIAALVQSEQSDLEAIFRLIVDHSRELIGTDLSWLSLVDESGERLVLRMASGAHTEALLRMSVKVGTGIGGIAVRERRPIIVLDHERYAEGLTPSIHDALVGEGVVSLLCVPMLHRDAMIGALYVASRERTDFGQTTASLLSAMAGQAAIAIQNARLYRQLVEKNETLERAFAVHRALTDASLSGAGLQEIVTELGRLVGRDLWLERETGLPRRVFSDGPAAHRPEDEPTGPAEGPAVAVMAGDRQLGTLRIRSPEPLDAVATKALEHGATVMGLQLLKEQAALEVEWRLGGELLEELLQAGDDPSPRLRVRAEQAAVDLEVRRCVAIFATESDELASKLLQLVQLNWRRGTRGHVLAAVRGARVVLAVEAPDARSGGETVRAIRDNALRAGIRSQVGVSAARSNLTLALPQAEAALSLALSGESGTLVDYAALGPLRFVLDAPHTREIAQLVQEVLGPLAEYDAARQGELVQTLRHYLEAGGHHPTTAQRCHIHVSTLKYRLARIGEITGWTITDPRARFQLTLAFELRDMLSRLGDDPLTRDA